MTQRLTSSLAYVILATSTLYIYLQIARRLLINWVLNKKPTCSSQIKSTPKGVSCILEHNDQQHKSTNSKDPLLEYAR